MTIGELNPIEHPDEWNTVTLQGMDTPGKCEVGEFKRSVKWDVKLGKGTAGATETVEGLPPAQGSIDFFAWEVAHFAVWDTLLPKLLYDPTKQTKQANSIFHPALADINVTSVNIEDIGSWVHQGGLLFKRTIAFLEFAPPPTANAVQTPTGADSSQASTPGAQPDPAIVALQKTAAQLTADAQKAYGTP